MELRGTKELGKRALLVGNIGKPPSDAGKAPFSATAAEPPASPVYCPTDIANAGDAFSIATVAGLVKKATCSCVRRRVPKGWPTKVVSNGTSPKLLAPMLEKPVSRRRVVS